MTAALLLLGLLLLLLLSTTSVTLARSLTVNEVTAISSSTAPFPIVRQIRLPARCESFSVGALDNYPVLYWIESAYSAFIHRLNLTSDRALPSIDVQAALLAAGARQRRWDLYLIEVFATSNGRLVVTDFANTAIIITLSSAGHVLSVRSDMGSEMQSRPCIIGADGERLFCPWGRGQSVEVYNVTGPAFPANLLFTLAMNGYPSAPAFLTPNTSSDFIIIDASGDWMRPWAWALRFNRNGLLVSNVSIPAVPLLLAQVTFVGALQVKSDGALVFTGGQGLTNNPLCFFFSNRTTYREMPGRTTAATRACSAKALSTTDRRRSSWTGTNTSLHWMRIVPISRYSLRHYHHCRRCPPHHLRCLLPLQALAARSLVLGCPPPHPPLLLPVVCVLPLPQMPRSLLLAAAMGQWSCWASALCSRERR